MRISDWSSDVCSSDLTGGAGIYRKLGLERLLRDVHGVQFHPLPEKRQLLFTGRVALGLDPVGNTAEAPRRAARVLLRGCGPGGVARRTRHRVPAGSPPRSF